MAETNRRLDDERRRIRTVLAHLDAGVVAFSDDGALLAINEAARRLLNRESATGTKTLEELLARDPLKPLRDFLDRAVVPGAPREATVTLGTRVVEARVARLPAHSGETASWVVTLEDTTALVAAERAAAWEEAARRMAHEIKNPLTPIRLAAERMRRRASAREAGAAPELATVVEEGPRRSSRKCPLSRGSWTASAASPGCRPRSSGRRTSAASCSRSRSFTATSSRA